MEGYEFSGTVEVFPGKDGWHHVRAPEDLTELVRGLEDRGLVPITATVGETSWPTSLLPMGDGTHFVALKAAVRSAEGVVEGDQVSLTLSLRER